MTGLACAQFGPSEVMQQHGFARNLDWEISATSADLQPDERDPSVELVLTDNEYTRAMWWGARSHILMPHHRHSGLWRGQ